MMGSESERIAHIKERVARLERGEKDPHVKTWDGAYYGDVYFLLGLIARTQVPTTNSQSRACTDCGHDEKFSPYGTCLFVFVKENSRVCGCKCSFPSVSVGEVDGLSIYERMLTVDWDCTNSRRHALIETRERTPEEEKEFRELQWLAGLKREINSGPLPAPPEKEK